MTDVILKSDSVALWEWPLQRSFAWYVGHLGLQSTFLSLLENWLSDW